MVGVTDTQGDVDSYLLTSSTRIGAFYHKLCRKQVAGYPWVNFLLAYMTDLLVVDMVEGVDMSVDCIDEEGHGDRSRQKFVVIRFQFGGSREDVIL